MGDANGNFLVIKKESIIQKHIRFHGKVVVGMYSNFWGNLEAKELLLGKGCNVRGVINCEKAIVGAYTRFNSMFAKNAFLLSKCKGHFVKGIDVKVCQGSIVDEVIAENLLLIGASRLKKLKARKVTVLKP